jgi:hypothetical protein
VLLATNESWLFCRYLCSFGMRGSCNCVRACVRAGSDLSNTNAIRHSQEAKADEICKDAAREG